MSAKLTTYGATSSDMLEPAAAMPDCDDRIVRLVEGWWIMAAITPDPFTLVEEAIWAVLDL